MAITKRAKLLDAVRLRTTIKESNNLDITRGTAHLSLADPAGPEDSMSHRKAPVSLGLRKYPLVLSALTR